MSTMKLYLVYSKQLGILNWSLLRDTTEVENVSVVATNAYLVLKPVFIGSLTVCCLVRVADADAQLLLRLCDSQSRHHLQRRTWRGKL